MAGRLGQIILESADPKEARKFYTDLGFKFDGKIDKRRMVRDKHGRRHGGLVLSIQKPMKITQELFGGPTAIVANVDKLDATLARLKKNWPKCFIGPIDVDAFGTRTVLLLQPGYHKIFLIETANFKKSKKKK